MSLPLTALLDFGAKLIDRVIPDPKAKYEATQKLIELQQAGELQVLAAEKDIALKQADILIEDAKSDDKMQRRARPFILWVCGVIFAAHFILLPLLFWVGLMFDPQFPQPPKLDIEQVMVVLGGILGLGGFRCYEKVRGKA